MGEPRHQTDSPPSRRSADPGRTDDAAAPRIEVVELRSFEAFYRSEWSAMVGLLFTLTGSREAAEELAQEALLRAYRSWGRISSYEKPGTWVRRVALNLAASRWRRQRSAARALLRWRPAPEVAPLDERTEAVWAAVRALPRRQAEVIALYYECDLSVDDIAETLDCAAGTVRTHLIRGRAALARTLGEEAR